jgi:hypothetical protein
MHERSLKKHEPSYVASATKPFLIFVVHSPLRAVGHMVAPELSPRGGRARNCEAHASAGALP